MPVFARLNPILHHYSTWVASAIAAATAAWQTMSPEQHAQALAMLPIDKSWLPWLSLAALLLAKKIPQSPPAPPS